MNPLKLRFYTERYEKENKFFRLHEKFSAVARTKPVTGKFYARHDTSQDDHLSGTVGKRPATDIYTSKPATVNSEYGWFSEPLIPPTNDTRLRFPRKEADFIANELRIRRIQRGLPADKFTGIPFRV
ncbi:unnamed protein product [Xylocopa violacea]|uniref:Uncharacterized protein n=1 Tax=Xylocopa violacea TaxID=135666 RepID=A0ABP1PH09_XYLVO